MSPATSDNLPEWLDPMVVKELRQGLRAKWFVVPFVAAHAGAIALVLAEAAAVVQPGGGSAASWEMLFWSLLALLVGGVLPLRCLGSIAEEMDQGSAHLIMVTGMSRWRMVVGKWLTQLVLAALLLGSLVPYGIVRYFFGGVEFVPSLLRLVGIVGAASSMNALCLGASGYARYALRAVILLLAVLYTGATLGMWIGLERAFAEVRGLRSPMSVAGFFSLVLGTLSLFGFLTLAGLQLARARLRAALRPWEVPPSRSIMILFVLSPFYFSIGGIISCGVGWPVFCGLMIWWIWSIDRPTRPAVRQWILPGTQPPPQVP